MKPSERHIHLGMFETAELIQELTNRENFHFVIGLCFIDGSGNADPDTIYCSGRWGVGEGEHFAEAISDYIEGAEDEDPK